MRTLARFLPVSLLLFAVEVAAQSRETDVQDVLPNAGDESDLVSMFVTVGGTLAGIALAIAVATFFYGLVMSSDLIGRKEHGASVIKNAIWIGVGSLAGGTFLALVWAAAQF